MKKTIRVVKKFNINLDIEEDKNRKESIKDIKTTRSGGSSS
jgi:phosphoribosylformylglycinamidine (FGAM) synthase PurS component